MNNIYDDNSLKIIIINHNNLLLKFTIKHQNNYLLLYFILTNFYKSSSS